MADDEARQTENWAKRRVPAGSDGAGDGVADQSGAQGVAGQSRGKPKKHISGARMAMALVVAVVSDALSVWLEFIPPVQWGLDLVTAVLLFLLLGARWEILPAMVMEAIPGVAALPFWVLVVGAVYASQKKGAGAAGA